MTQLFGPGCPWYGMYELFGEANVKWCEERLCTWFNEPANAWSNLIYIFVALLILRTAKRSDSPHAPQWKLYAWAVMFMGAMSFWYHASNNYFTQIFDFIGMFVWLVYLLILNLKRLDAIKSSASLPLYIVLVIALTGLVPVLHNYDIKYQILIPILALGLVITEIMIKRKTPANEAISYRWFFASLITFIVAGSFSASDVSRKFCNPTDHWIQGHAIWHILGGIGIYFVFLFYKQVKLKG